MGVSLKGEFTYLNPNWFDFVPLIDQINCGSFPTQSFNLYFLVQCVPSRFIATLKAQRLRDHAYPRTSSPTRRAHGILVSCPEGGV